jgi:hypothetical protein
MLYEPRYAPRELRCIVSLLICFYLQSRWCRTITPTRQSEEISGLWAVYWRRWLPTFVHGHWLPPKTGSTAISSWNALSYLISSPCPTVPTRSSQKYFRRGPECRPSLDEIRREVLAMDTFFLTDREAFICGWADRLEKNMRLKMGVPMISSCCSDETSSVSCYPPTSSSSCSSSASCYSCGSSSSAFESISLESSAAPATPPAPAVEAFYSMGKVVS